MFVYQKKIFIPLSEPCPEEVFFGAVRAAQTKWLVDNLRMALDYAERDVATWPKRFSEDFMRYLQEQTAKPKVGKMFAQKTQKEKLLAYAKSLKDKLPAAIFQARGFDLTLSDKAKEKITDETTAEEIEAMKRPWVKQAAVQLSGLCVLDVDHVENPQGVFDNVIMKECKNEKNGILLVYITPSGKGLKVVFKADVARGNLIENQLWLAGILGVKADEGCKDASRRSYLTTEEDILFINKEELFHYENKEFAEKYDAEYRAGHSAATKADAVAGESVEQGAGDVGQMDAVTVPLSFKGRPYAEIIDAWWQKNGGVPEPGERNVKLYHLAVNLRAICDNDKSLLMQVMPRLGLDEQELQGIVDSACKEPPKGISKLMQGIIAMSDVRSKMEGGSMQSTLNAQLDGWGKEIESMFGDFPLLQDVCQGLKRSQYPAALFVAGGVLMTLMTRCWYRFYHRPQQERRLNCSLYIIGHPASNKSMADDICEALLLPMQQADQAGKAALNRYKKDSKKKAANKEGKDKPQGIIRIHPSRTSNGQLIEDMLNAKEIVDGKEMQLHMFTFDTELDNSITLQSGGSWINKQAMELKAFHNEKDGQMYQNSDSPVDEFRVTWNYIYTGTPIALKKKVNERNFGSGLSTRLAVIPMPKTNYEMIEFEEQTDIDWQRLARMKDWAYRLDTRSGELPLWPLVRRLYDWTKLRMDDCREDDSEANELMLKRVPYHALNYSAPFIDMRHWGSLHEAGGQWMGKYEVDDTDWKLCELIARIQYAMQQRFFGVLAEKYFDDMNNDVQFTGKRHQKKSIEGYNHLADVFTKEDVVNAFQYNNTKAADKKIERLLENGLVEKIKEGDNAGKYLKKQKILV